MLLDLSNNKIDDGGFDAIALALGTNSALQTLYLEGNNFSGRVLPHLTETLTKNTYSRLFKLHLGHLLCTE